MKSIVLNSLKHYYGYNSNATILKNQSFPRLLFETFMLLIIYRILYALSIMAFDFIFKTGFQKIPMSTIDSFVTEIGKLKFWLLAGFLGPVYEEFMFRSPLNNSRKTIFVSVITIIFFIPFSSRIFSMNVIYVVMFSGLLTLNYLSTRGVSISNFKKNICFGSSVLFALFHLPNFVPITQNKIILLPFALMPYFILGLILSIIRIEKGLVYAILFHLLFNNISLSFRFV